MIAPPIATLQAFRRENSKDSKLSSLLDCDDKGQVEVLVFMGSTQKPRAIPRKRTMKQVPLKIVFIVYFLEDNKTNKLLMLMMFSIFLGKHVTHAR